MRALFLILAGVGLAGAVVAAPAIADETTQPAAALGSAPSAAAPTLTYTEPSATGIPYRWWVTLGSSGQVNFAYYVGARSWWEPANPPATPGWTHNSNWVALTLSRATWVTVKISPSVAVPCAPPSQPAACDTTGHTGSYLYPAVSLYSRVDTTSAQDHTFNPIGNGWWSTIRYIDSSFRSNPVTHVLTFTKFLPSGKYTINIGGAGAKALACGPTKPCYSGGQSYKAAIFTFPAS